MLCEVRSLGLSGIAGYEVKAECDLSAGLPAFEVVGLPDAAVNEARERVRSAIKNCGFSFPVSRITVNLAPAHVKKIGTLYDLPILVGLLAAGDKAAAQAALLDATSEIDKATSKGVYHKNNASRKVSRLSKAVNSIA